jgi:hypothetical protein
MDQDLRGTPGAMTRALPILLLLAGCASTGEPFLVGPQIDRVLLTVRWIEPGQACGGRAEACASIPQPILMQTMSTPVAAVWAVKPSGFDDTRNVCTLGHEILHALGARHHQPALYAVGGTR